MGEHIGTSRAGGAAAARVVVGIALVVVAALGIVRPGAPVPPASAAPYEPYPTVCPVAPGPGEQADTSLLPQDPCEPPDPCGTDSDGDGLLDCEDPCPSDPADTCDDPPPTTPPTTPPTPPATSPTSPPTTSPTSAPAPTTTPTAPPTALPGCSTGCAYARTVGLRLKGSRLRGRVASSATGCRSGASVTLWQVRKGADRRLVVLTTRASGSFSTRRPARSGRYYVTVASPDQPLCGQATSRKVRVRR